MEMSDLQIKELVVYVFLFAMAFVGIANVVLVLRYFWQLKTKGKLVAKRLFMGIKPPIIVYLGAVVMIADLVLVKKYYTYKTVSIDEAYDIAINSIFSGVLVVGFIFAVRQYVRNKKNDLL